MGLRDDADDAIGRLRMAGTEVPAHVQLTVSDMARCLPFYDTPLHSPRMVTLVRSPQWFHCGGGETGVAICPVDDACRCDAFVPRRGRLHHFCFRTKTREDVAAIPAVAVKLGAQIIGSPREADAAAGSYSVLFEDPEGLRIEANPIPGKGHLESSKPGGASAPLGPPARRRLLVVVARAYLDGRDD